MLRRIRINGYKSLTGIDVALKPLSVLFGPNAAGKSNFLDVLQLLARIAKSEKLKYAFEPPYRGTPLESFSFNESGLPGLLQKECISFWIEADIELSSHVVASVNRQIRDMKQSFVKEDGGKEQGREGTENDQAAGDKDYIREKLLRYRIEIEILPTRGGVLRVADEYLAALNEKTGEPQVRRKPFLKRVDNRFHLRIEGQAAHPRYYERYLDHSILSLPLYPPHHPHVVAVRQELASWFFFYFEPRERMRALNPVKEVRHIGLMGEELASFLNTLRALDPSQFRAVEKALHMIVPTVTGLDVGVNPLGQVELRLKEGDTEFPASVVSEGTLRVLGMLALAGAKEPPALVGFEEPENGIPPRRISMIAEMLKSRSLQGGTQTIVTTHSPLLPDLIPNNSLYVCRKKDRRTEITPFMEPGPLFRKSFIDDALEELPETSVSERIRRGDFDA